MKLPHYIHIAPLCLVALTWTCSSRRSGWAWRRRGQCPGWWRTCWGAGGRCLPMSSCRKGLRSAILNRTDIRETTGLGEISLKKARGTQGISGWGSKRLKLLTTSRLTVSGVTTSPGSLFVGVPTDRGGCPQKSHCLPDNDVSPTSSVSPMKMTFICRLWVSPVVINIVSSPRSSPVDDALFSSKTLLKQLTHCWNPHSSLWWFVIMWIIKQQFHQELIATF